MNIHISENYNPNPLKGENKNSRGSISSLGHQDSSTKMSLIQSINLKGLQNSATSKSVNRNGQAKSQLDSYETGHHSSKPRTIENNNNYNYSVSRKMDSLA